MSEYLSQAKTFLQETNTKMSIVFDSVKSDKEIGWNNGNMMHNCYTVTLSRNGKSYQFPFYDSYHNYIEGNRPNAYDILSTMEKYEVCDSLEEFCNEYGYEINSIEDCKRVEKTWKNCKKQYEKLYRLFDYDNDLMEMLAEIQ